ncbi:hypothetical protein pb186bvf_015448 [Paramecium bursaria]
MCVNIQDIEQLLIRILKPIVDKLETVNKMQGMMEAIKSTLKKELDILRRDNVDITYLRKQFDKIQQETFEITIPKNTQPNIVVPQPNQQWDFQQQNNMPQPMIPQNQLQANPAIEDDTTVYKSASGEVYHKQNCVHKSSFTSALSINKAKNQGLRPCKVCYKPIVRQ